MKSNKIIFSSLAIAAVMLTGCKDEFLEVSNPTGDPLEDYYTTDAHIQEAVIAAYDPIHWHDYGQGTYNALNICSEVMADGLWVGGADKNDMAQWHKLFNYEADANNTLGSLWTIAYSGIKRCNDVIFYMDNYVPEGEITPQNDALYRAQVRVLRAFYYNILWHYFGNIPFYLDNLLKPPYTAEQISADQVYANLIPELEATIDSNILPLRYYKNADGANDNSQLGRVTNAMAYMLYTEMVMYQNDEARFPKALGYMRDLIANGGFELNPNFADIWEPSGEWCDESIWEINYEQTNSERDWGSPLMTGGMVIPTLISPNGFPGDAEWSAGQDGWGFMPVRAESYAMYTPGDTRRDGSIWVIDPGVDYTLRYQDTHMWLNKYRPKDVNCMAGNSSHNLNYANNYRYYRYSEALLNAAELAVRTGGSPTGEAKIWLNRVRTRAGLGEKDATIDNILTERRYEFLGEGKRYFDLVRAEGISGVSAANHATTALVPDQYGYRTNSWTPVKKYIPIAQGELDSDPALVQNPY